MDAPTTRVRIAREQDGQTLVEYALILALVSTAAAVLLNLGLVEGGIAPFFTGVSTLLNSL